MKKSTTGEFETAVFAARLRELIRDTKTTQKDLAKAIGAAKNTVSAYAHGLCSPTLPILVRIAKHFDVSMDYLAGLTDKKNKHRNPSLRRSAREMTRGAKWRYATAVTGADAWRLRAATGTARHVCTPTRPGFFASRRRWTITAHIIKTANAEWAAKTAKVKPQHHDNTKGD